MPIWNRHAVKRVLCLEDPIGFWDPLGRAVHWCKFCLFDLSSFHDDLLGLSADKDQSTFKRRRAVEIKHGRIAADSSRFKPMNIA